jgi:hypothetical protein
VAELWFVAEIADRHALRISVISLAERLNLGLCGDARALPDLDVLAGALEEEVQAMAALAQVSHGHPPAG